MTSRRLPSAGLRRMGIGGAAAAGLLALIAGAWSLAPDQSFASNKGNSAMSSNIDCTENAVARSRCIIEAILSDVSETYDSVGGGGISSIKQDATWTYTVSISQEERVDQITYTVAMSPDGKVTIKDRKAGTKSFGN